MSWASHECFDTNHKFEPRYDIEPLMTKLKGNVTSTGMVELLEAATKKTYVQDVCVYCGKVAKREEE